MDIDFTGTLCPARIVDALSLLPSMCGEQGATIFWLTHEPPVAGVVSALTVHAPDTADKKAIAAAVNAAPETPDPPTPAELAAVPVQMAAANLAVSFTTTNEVAAAAEQLHAAAKAGIANFKKDIAAWPTLTDAQKLSHVEGLMQSMVGVLQNLTGDYS